MKINSLENIQCAHFIGIGGIGMSALARFFVDKGIAVTGSDRTTSRITEDLKKLGVEVFIGHKDTYVPNGTDIVVYSLAIPDDNPERQVARAQSIPVLSYPEALGMISKHTFTIAVSGAHGKTTTTAMLAHILGDTQVHPTVIVGSLLRDTESNFVAGSDKYLLVEACEYRRSFLHLEPNILVITNIDTEHLDYYKNLEDIQHAFNELVRKVPREGFVVCDFDDERVQPTLAGVQAGVVNYRSYMPETIELRVFGEHNKENAAAAVAVAAILGLSEEAAYEKLKTFSGTWRRAEKVGVTKEGVEVYDDYAHHPTEIRATLASFRKRFPDKRIVVVFQPHLYSRTKALLDEFAESFADADEVFVMPIYAAREKDSGEVRHTDLAAAIRDSGTQTQALDGLSAVPSAVADSVTAGDIIITMGAGDVYTVTKRMVY